MNKFLKLIFGFLIICMTSSICLADANIAEIITYPELKVFEKSKYDEIYSKFSYQEIISISINNFDVRNQKAELTINLKICADDGGCFVMPLTFPCILK